jgi:K+-sensing histidine kinase KdpD
LLAAAGDLLDVTRAQAGKLQLDLSPVDLRSVATAAVASVRGTPIGSRTITATVPESASLVDGDAVRGAVRTILTS